MFDTLYSQIREADRGIFVQGDPLNMCTTVEANNFHPSSTLHIHAFSWVDP